MKVGDGQQWRERISSLVFSSDHPTVIAAPPGFGVSTLAAYLGSSVHPTPASVVDLHAVDVAELSIDALRQQHVVFVAREIPDLTKIPGAQLISHSQLRFTEDEAIEVAEAHGVDASVARSIHLFTAGWPGYFNACLDVLSQDARTTSSPPITADDAYDRLHKGPHLRALISTCTADLTPTDHSQIAQLTHFTKISPGLVEALLGPKGLSRIQRSGLPIVETQPGWYEILEPVRGVLRSSSTLDEQTARKLAPELIAEAGMVAGARILLAAGQPAAAATALRSVPVHELDEGSQPTLLSLLRTVLDSEKDDGSLRLRLARVYHNHGDLVSLRRSLEDATVAAIDQLRPDLELEAQSELLLLDLDIVDHEIVRDRLEILQSKAKDHANQSSLIRLREVALMLESEREELDHIYSAASRLESVANDWELIGENARAAATLRMLASRPLFHLGRHAKGVEVAKRACELSQQHPQGHLKSLLLLARELAMTADHESFLPIADRVSELAPASGLAWIDAYDNWARMVMAGFALDDQGVMAHQRRGESLMPRELLEHGTGAIFFSDAATAAATAGELESASTFLDRALQRRALAPLDVGCAEVLVLAYRRDPQCKDALEVLATTTPIPAERKWRLDLAVELALGEPSSSRHDEAVQHGLERVYDSTIRAFAATSAPESVSLKLLGDFAVQRGSRSIPVAGGKATELVKFLGVRMKAVPADVVIDYLWGNVSTDVGLRRLKNVVSRARASLGQDAIERRGQTVGLGAHVTSDLAELRTLLRHLRVEPNDTTAARRCVELYAGPLLELDVYDDWVAAERESLAAAVLSALELVVDAADAPSAWTLDALARIQPNDDRPYMAVADLAERQQDATTLRLALAQVRRICLALDLDVPAGYDRLHARITELAVPDAVGAFEGSGGNS